MKKVLFATTALVALGLTPLVAQAQDQKPAEKPITLGLGGYFRAFAIAGSQDDGDRNNSVIPGGPLRDHGIGRESEIWFKGETSLDNGLRVGVQVELEGETSADQIDNSYIYFQHSQYGRLIVGEDFGSSVKTHKGVVGLNAGLGAISHFASQGSFNGKLNTVGGNSLNTFMVLDGTSDKAIYDTPRIYGLRLSTSYTPDDKTSGIASVNSATGESGLGLNSKQDGFTALSQVWTVSGDYVETFGPVGVAFSAGYQRAYRERAAGGRDANNDPDSWNLGAEVSYAGFRLGAAYKRINNNVIATNAALIGARGIRAESLNGHGGNNGAGFVEGDREDFIVGLDYTFGPWTVGATYGFVNQHGIQTRTNNSSGNPAGSRDSTDTLDQWTVGVNYALGPGIALYAGYQGFDLAGLCNGRTPAGPGNAPGNPRSNSSCANNDGHLFIVGTQLNF